MTNETHVQWVDNSLEGSTQTSNQQLCHIVTERGSARVFLCSAAVCVLFKNCSDVENALVKK